MDLGTLSSPPWCDAAYTPLVRLIVAESHKDNAIESGIGLSIASAVESVAFGLA